MCRSRGKDGDAVGLQGAANRPREGRRVAAIAVQAQRVGAQGHDATAGARDDLALAWPGDAPARCASSSDSITASGVPARQQPADGGRSRVRRRLHGRRADPCASPAAGNAEPDRPNSTSDGIEGATARRWHRRRRGRRAATLYRAPCGFTCGRRMPSSAAIAASSASCACIRSRDVLGAQRQILPAKVARDPRSPGCAPAATPNCAAQPQRRPHRRRRRRHGRRRRCWRK